MAFLLLWPKKVESFCGAKGKEQVEGSPPSRRDRLGGEGPVAGYPMWPNPGGGSWSGNELVDL